MKSAQDVLAFWLDELSPEDWYQGGEALDAAIRERFEATWNAAQTGACGFWLTHPSGALAYIILNDQFPRNMFRGSAKAFSSDRRALAAAKAAIDRRWDLKIDEPARQFFYLPLEHSENLCDQDRAVRLMAERMDRDQGLGLLHARAHREIIRRFGRFPFRNEALGRRSSSSEAAFIAEGGYGAIVRALQANAA